MLLLSLRLYYILILTFSLEIYWHLILQIHQQKMAFLQDLNLNQAIRLKFSLIMTPSTFEFNKYLNLEGLQHIFFFG